MKHRIAGLFLSILALTAFAVPAPAATVEKVPLAPPTIETAPPAPPGVKRAPGTLAPADFQLRGPTENLTTIANRMRLEFKSLTTQVTVIPGLPVTQPVEISIGYYSPAGSNRITQSYLRSTGNRFLYNDAEGDGKPRKMRIDVSLREPKPDGGFYTFAFPWEVTLDPLYDVTISPMKFSLISNCDTVGNNEILFGWISPDGQDHSREFSCGRDECFIDIHPFAWDRAEVSAAHKLHRESFAFRDKDNPVVEFFWECLRGGVGAGCGFAGGVAPGRDLVPGATATIKGNLKAVKGTCEAYFQYTITYQLRSYPHL